MILILSSSYTASRETASELGLASWRHVDGIGSLAVGTPSQMIRAGCAGRRHDYARIEAEAATRGISVVDADDFGGQGAA